MTLDYFKHAFFINLDQRPDRLAHIEQQLESARWLGKVERFRGITPSHRRRFYKKGARGNWLSHAAIWRETVRRGFDVRLVADKLQEQYSEVTL